MHDFYEELEKLCKTIEGEIEEANEKIRKSGGKISPGDIDYVDKLAHTIKSIKTTMAMMDAESEADGMMYNGSNMGSYGPYYHSNARGRKRDSMGRYSRANRSYDDGMLHELRDLMNRTTDDRMRSEIGNLVSRMEQM